MQSIPLSLSDHLHLCSKSISYLTNKSVHWLLDVPALEEAREGGSPMRIPESQGEISDYLTVCLSPRSIAVKTRIVPVRAGVQPCILWLANR